MAYRAVIFDLDGTLLDTLGDLHAAVNTALRSEGFPERSEREVMAFLGNGIRRLMQQAVPGGTDEARFERAFEAFKSCYSRHYLEKTRPYPGIPALLQELKRRGIRTALVTNKADAVARDIYNATLRDVLPVAIGEQPSYRKKPAPDMVDEALRRLGCGREGAVCVGDSEVDLQTAKNSGLPCILVDWGFRSRSFLETLGCESIVSTPEQLLEQLTGAH